MARVVLAEPWFGGSHRAWAEGLARHSRHDITIVGLPDRLWRWRLRAGAAPLAAKIGEVIEQEGEPDLLVVSGLVDVAALLGHLRPSPTLPVVTYMHESQLVYPTASGSVDDDAVLRNVESWRASDQVWFNSSYHRDAVVAALPTWARAQPEPLDVDGLGERFRVVPVGVEPPSGERPGPGEVPVILWPHRWEPDKRPDVFLRALDRLVDAGVDFRLVLAGEDPASSAERQQIIERHGDRVLAAGPFERAEYERWLFASDVVVSCAEHEFFGIAVVEALLAGCVPVLPDALSYPELIPPRFHDAALYRVGSFGGRLEEVVSNVDRHRSAVPGLAGAMRRFTWADVVVDYDRIVDAIAAPTSSGP